MLPVSIFSSDIIIIIILNIIITITIRINISINDNNYIIIITTTIIITITIIIIIIIDIIIIIIIIIIIRELVSEHQSEGGMMQLETLLELKLFNSSFSNSTLSIRVVRAFLLLKLNKNNLYRAIRADSISVNCTLPPS